MDWVYRVVRFGHAQLPGCLIVVHVLGAVAIYAAWRGWKTRFRGTALALIHAVLFFVAARVPFWTYRAGSDDAVFPAIIAFSALSLLSFYFLALAAVKLRSAEAAAPEGGSGGTPSTEPRLPDRLLKEMLLVGAAAACLFVALSGAGNPAAVVVGFLNWFLAGASFRLVLFVAVANRKLRTVAVAAAVSWLLYQAVPLVGEAPGFLTLHAARGTDVLTLALIVAVVLGSYVRWGARSEQAAHERETEMQAAKGELARLNRIAKDIYEDSNDVMAKQKQRALAAVQRAEGLEKILQVGSAIHGMRQLDDVLGTVVEFVHEHLGFKTVTLRLLNEKTGSFETRSHVGLDPHVRDRVVNTRVPVAEFEKIVDPRRRIGKIFFVSSRPSQGEAPSEPHEGEEMMLVQNGLDGIEMLVVPLATEEGRTIGYLTAENPADSSAPLNHVLEMLERTAVLAVSGIRSAGAFEALKRKDEKLKEFAEKLARLNKMKSNFVATMSHEFRTPLTSIKAYCDTLIKNADSVDKDLLKEFLSVIDEESGRLMALVEDILDFSRIESGAMRFEKRPCDLRRVVEDAASELAKNFELKEIAFHRDLPDGEILIHGEQELIKQLVVSLLHNASKFCEPRGNVWLRVEDEAAAARVVVEDDGAGVPEDQLEKVFEQFYQVDGSTTREHGGSGLGLALCRSIVEWHNGRIWVQNMVGGGARFVAVLPKKQAITRSHAMGIANTVRKMEVGRFLELAVESVSELMRASRVSLMLLDSEGTELRIEAAIGVEEDVIERARLVLGEAIAGRVAARGESMLVRDIDSEGRLGRKNNSAIYGSKSFLCVPIVRAGKTVGVVNVSNPVGRGAFDERDLSLLETLSRRLGVALDKLRTFTEASEVYERMLEAYKAILDARRFVAARDDDGIASLVGRVAEKLGVDAETRAALPYVMAVYDLGLSRVGGHVLNKPSGLSAKDREEIENHTVAGKELLNAIESDPKVGEIVLYHHENFDGSGYPGKLKGESIPIGARIVRVADSLKALISERPYQRRYTFEEAIEILKHRSGTFFDPRVVDAFIEIITETAGAERSRAEAISAGSSPAPTGGPA